MKSNHQLTITAHDRLGELERILRVIRHRGGAIDQLTMAREGTTFTLNVVLTTERAIESLVNQIAKLANVLSVLKVN
ncbi:acetolactate synthase 2 small subunit [Orbaceae bacterium ESL0721]|nr:acetolactate synthase 2 small subunit [Orbaceae bacterium ESL0721]